MNEPASSPNSAATHAPRGAIAAVTNLKSRQLDLADVVALVWRHIGVDVAVVAELTAGGQAYRAVAGDAQAFDIALSASVAGPGTYSQRLVTGELPSVICGATGDARVVDPVLGDAPVGLVRWGCSAALGWEPVRDVVLSEP